MSAPDAVSRETPPPPEAAGRLFGSRLPLAVRYADFLAGEGTVRGLLGPREVPKLWERHLLNCGVLASVLPAQCTTVADVGSGAGLPGVVLAILRPEIAVTLIDPMLRRTRFLSEAADTLGLDNVSIMRARAEGCAGRTDPSSYDVVTARAVAPLDRLARWCLPLVRPGGELLAMKGSAATEEVAAARRTISRLGGADAEVIAVGRGVVDPPTTVVRVQRLA